MYMLTKQCKKQTPRRCALCYIHFAEEGTEAHLFQWDELFVFTPSFIHALKLLFI